MTIPVSGARRYMWHACLITAAESALAVTSHPSPASTAEVTFARTEQRCIGVTPSLSDTKIRQ